MLQCRKCAINIYKKFGTYIPPYKDSVVSPSDLNLFLWNERCFFVVAREQSSLRSKKFIVMEYV